jgi:hypothetical protein
LNLCSLQTVIESGELDILRAYVQYHQFPPNARIRAWKRSDTILGHIIMHNCSIKLV